MTVASLHSELAALREGAALIDLSARAKIVATGADRIRWFNGMVTNNIRDLALNRGVYSYLLNAQGRILGDMYIYHRGEYLLVDADREQAGKMREIFDRYIIMDDVELSDASDKIGAVGLWGARSRDVLERAAIPTPALQPLEVADLSWRGMGISLLAQEWAGRYEVWAGSVNLPAVREALLAAGAKPVTPQAIELSRIADGIPRYGVDIRERDLPQETGQEQRALNFNKGCYVGQEIVERIHSRGNVHRLFTRFEAEGEVEPGMKIQAGGKDVGELTSVGRLPGGRTIALGYVRREALVGGAELTAGAVRLHPSQSQVAV